MGLSNEVSNDRKSNILWVLLLLLVCQTPFAIVYLINLASVPHYDFFPAIIALVGVFLWWRLGGINSDPLGRIGGFVSVGVICLSCGLTVAGLLFASPWFAYLGFCLTAALILGQLTDSGNPQHSLVPLALPLFLLWQPPYSTNQTADYLITARLQSLSSRLVGQLLDIVAIPHVNLGTVIEIPGLQMGVEEACSGVRSLFLFFAVAICLILVFRRSTWHAIVLFASSVLWAIFTNTTRIISIGLAHHFFGIDLTHGFAHEMLGYTLMLTGIGLLISFDCFLTAVLPTSHEELFEPQLKPIENWRRLGKKLLASPPSKSGFVLGAAFAFLFVLQLFDLTSLLAQDRTRIDFFAESPLIDVNRNWLPSKIGNWQMAEFTEVKRDRGADLGQRSNSWIYKNKSSGQQFSVSFDQAYPGWHELTRCYVNMGWGLESRRTISSSTPCVEASLLNGAKQVELRFTIIDQNGDPISPPSGNWIGFLTQRIKNRLSPSIRGGLFSKAAYQIQVVSSSQISNELFTELTDQIRDHVAKSDH